MYNEFAETITKESDPVRQKHYTTKKTWLVDFINIFLFILKLFLHLRQIPCFWWYFPYWLWNLFIPSVSCTAIFYLVLQKSHWMCSTMSALMQRLIIPGLWTQLPGSPCIWFRKNSKTSRCFCALMIPWSQSLVWNSKMFQNFLTTQHIMVPATLMVTAL